MTISTGRTDVMPATVPVIDLAARQRCDAFEAPHWYQPDMRATRRGSSVFLGQLICGITGAYEQLATLPPSTQRRYRRKVQVQARGRRGHPIKLPCEANPIES